MSGPSNGASPPGLPPGMNEAEFEQLKQMATEQTVGAMLPLLIAFLPQVQPGRLEQIARGVVQQQQHEDFTRILDDATDPSTRSTHELWGCRLERVQKSGGRKVELTLEAPKDASRCTDADSMLRFVTILGLVTNPTARAVLLAVGLQPHFFQKKASPIVTL